MKSRTTPTGRKLELVKGGRGRRRRGAKVTRAEYLAAALGFMNRQLSAGIEAGTTEDFLVINLGTQDSEARANLFTTSEEPEAIGVAVLALIRYGLEILKGPADTEDDGE